MKLRLSIVLLISLSILAMVGLAACGTSSPSYPVQGSPAATASSQRPGSATQATAPTASGAYLPPPTQPAAPTASGTYPAPSSQPAAPTASGTYPAPGAQPAQPTASGTYPAPTTTIPTASSVITPTVTPVGGRSGVQLPGDNIAIDVSAPGSTAQTLTPGETAYLNVGSGEINVLIRYPNPIGRGSGASFVPYQVTVTVDPVGWRAVASTSPNDNTLAFRLLGNATGHFTVNVGSMPTNPSVTFGVDIVNPLTPTIGSVAGNPSAGQTITLADNGTTLHFQVGDRFLLDLGNGYDWTVNVADQNVVRRIVNVTVIRGAQGVYVAHAAGQTALTAVGDPACRQAKPACAVPSRTFKVTIDVQ